jgi:APA family basic amino acid/polyamine antiporter
MSLTMTGLISYKALDRPAPIYVAVAAAGPALAWLQPLVSVCATAGLASAVLALLFSQSRLLYAMARDGLLPGVFARLRPNSRTPAFGVVLSALIASAFAAFLPMGLLGEFVSAGTLLAMAAVCASVIYLRIAQPAASRAFRTPAWRITASVALGSCLYFLASLGALNLVRLAIWMGAGLIVYFAYSRRTGRGWIAELPTARPVPPSCDSRAKLAPGE